MQARYYDPKIGRFYGVDPVGYRDVHSFNRFAYANNNPYRYVDPDGRASKKVSKKVVKNVAQIADKSPYALVGGETLAIGTILTIEVLSDNQELSKVMDTIVGSTPVTGVLTSIPGVGQVLSEVLDTILNPADSEDLTDEQLQEGNFDGRIRVTNMEQFEKRSQKKEIKETQKNVEKESKD